MKKTMTLCMIFFCAAVLSACTGNADNTNTVNSSGTAVETASEENPEDHFDDAEKTVDNKAPWIQEYEYPSEFSMGDNLKTAVIQLALCYDNFDKDSVCSEEWKEIFVSRFIQNTRSSFDYLDMVSGKNNGQISVDELNYIQYSLTGIELDFSSFAGDGLDRYDAASGGEARYISKKQDGNEDPVKAFHYLLEPGEETGMVEIGYIVEDSILNDSADLYYCIGQRGSEMGNPENRYIEVEK